MVCGWQVTLYKSSLTHFVYTLKTLDGDEDTTDQMAFTGCLS